MPSSTSVYLLCVVSGCVLSHLPVLHRYVCPHQLVYIYCVLFQGAFSLIYLCSTDMYALINWCIFTVCCFRVRSLSSTCAPPICMPSSTSVYLLCVVSGWVLSHLPVLHRYVCPHQLVYIYCVLFQGAFSLIYLCSTDMYALINWCIFTVCCFRVRSLSSTCAPPICMPSSTGVYLLCVVSGCVLSHLPVLHRYVCPHQLVYIYCVLFQGGFSLIYLCSTDMYALIN